MIVIKIFCKSGRWFTLWSTGYNEDVQCDNGPVLFLRVDTAPRREYGDGTPPCWWIRVMALPPSRNLFNFWCILRCFWRAWYNRHIFFKSL